MGVVYARRASSPWRNVSTTVIKSPKVPTVGTRLEENKDVKESFTVWLVADRINIRIFLRAMIYSTVSARFMAQLNMSFMQYLLFWNCRCIAWYWQLSINRLWHNRWRCGRRRDPWCCPHMHPLLIHPGTVALNVCTTRSRESTAPSAVFYKATTVPGGAEVEVDCLTLSEWNPFRLVANLTWMAVFIFLFFLLSMLVLYIILTIMTSNLIRFLSFPTRPCWDSLLSFCLFMLENKEVLWKKLWATSHSFLSAFWQNWMEICFQLY